MFELNVLNFVGHIQGLALEEAIVVFYLLSDFFLQRGDSSVGCNSATTFAATGRLCISNY